MPRTIYRLLSYWWPVKALAKRGPGAFARQRGRAYGMRQASRMLRKVFPF